MADIFVMRLHDVELCSCGAEVSSEHPGTHRSSSQPLCPTCREAEVTRSALVTRRTLTHLVADERGYALHRRVLPEARVPVDHLFVGASGVYVIKVVRFPDVEVGLERTGGRFAAGTEVLTLDGVHAPHLVDAVHAQCAEVAEGLADLRQGDVPVIPVLCFVHGRLPRRARNRRIDDVRLTAGMTLADEVGGEGPFDADRRFALAMALVSFLPSTA